MGGFLLEGRDQRLLGGAERPEAVLEGCLVGFYVLASCTFGRVGILMREFNMSS